MDYITVKKQEEIKQDGKAYPDNRPCEGLPEANDMGMAPDDLQVKEKNAQDKDQEENEKAGFCRNVHRR